MEQLIDHDGIRHPDPELDRWVADVDAEVLAALYRDMVIVRRIDAEGIALQRQGQVGLWPPVIGQEAAQVGSVRAMRATDWAFGSYRELAVAWCRGVSAAGLVTQWRGTAASGWDPYAHRVGIPQIIIGAQTLHATGNAIGQMWERLDEASVAYFGDGATSEGDVSEAMIFASTFKAPVVFFCQNNHWAISEPVDLQSKQPIAKRADGFGMPGVRVDGNDVLAVMAVTRRALDRARRGDGPTFIEAVTYRMGPHTTADDPTRYRSAEEVERWRERDPIARVLALLEGYGVDTVGLAERVDAEAADAATEVRAVCIGMPDPEPLTVFDHVYAEPNSNLSEQRAQYAAYLQLFEGGAQ
ncbi:MAG TPA: pyruvate dehydrogenase (acetyl-transferring) E1 component subunit alpha [Candidatus Lumbricidophila sp.]|nr:pyruvate dehydrogenase (acetyl-transferring) E1 component subunit alpha [Candidatus Lumbricidophila sp.]